jgi:hypothetical protein
MAELQWNLALATFLDDFQPADDLTDSTHQYSTNEIIRMLSDHTGELITAQELCSSMEALHFKFVRTGDLQLEWLLKKV